jgi:hypothetical protein
MERTKSVVREDTILDHEAATAGFAHGIVQPAQRVQLPGSPYQRIRCHPREHKDADAPLLAIRLDDDAAIRRRVKDASEDLIFAPAPIVE